MTTDNTYPFDPDYVVHPGASLREWFDSTRLPLSIAWNIYGIDKEDLDGIFEGTEPITPDLARRLMNLTSISARFWLSFEHNFRVGLAAGKHWAPDEP